MRENKNSFFFLKAHLISPSKSMVMKYIWTVHRGCNFPVWALYTFALLLIMMSFYVAIFLDVFENDDLAQQKKIPFHMDVL